MTYLFGHSAGETDRLLRQARLFGPYTRRLLEDAGIAAGMRVLDVGSGAGDVSLILADMVGASGTVMGIDINAELLETARARADAAGLRNVTFTVGMRRRWLWMATLTPLLAAACCFSLRTGCRWCADLPRTSARGALSPSRSRVTLPCARPHCRPRRCLIGSGAGSWSCIAVLRWTCMRACGSSVFSRTQACQILRCIWTLPWGAAWTGRATNTSRGLSGRSCRGWSSIGVAAADEVDIDSLADRLRAETVASRGVMTTWSFITAWAPVPGSG